MGISGDPVQGRRLIEWAKKEKKQLKFNPYGYPRAFTVSPSEEILEQLHDLIEWTWGKRIIEFCDPMSGGGSIPSEALRYELSVSSNELNPVASIILKGTLEYPAKLGPVLAEDIRKYGRTWCEKVRDRMDSYNQPFQHDGHCIIISRGNGLRLSQLPRQGCVSRHLLVLLLALALTPVTMLAVPGTSVASRISLIRRPSR